MTFRTLAVVLCVAALADSARSDPFRLGGTPPPPQVPVSAPAPADDPAPALVPEFPPGLFTDAGRYRLNNLAGRVVVLIFFDGDDPRFAATVPHRAAIMRLFQDRPVAIFGVQVADIDKARSDARRLDLTMPVFADTLGVMHLRYRVALTAARSWHVTIIGADGEITHEEITPDLIEAALKKARWNYRDNLEPYDAKLGPAVDLLEAGDYDNAARQINMVANGMDRKAAQSARQMLDLLRTEADLWIASANAMAASQPLRAYDLYARANFFLAASERAKPLAQALKQLEADPRIQKELAARTMYDRLGAAVSRDQSIDKWDATGYCREIIRAQPGTPTAHSLVTYLDDLGRVRDRTPTTVRRRRPG